MRTRFVKMEWENAAQTIGTVYLKPDKPYYFTAGQYADITVPHDKPDALGTTRTMTFSSSPGAPLLAFTCRLAGRTSSYKAALSHLQPGDLITVTDAMGDMVLPLDASIPLIFVAGGLSIASYISMTRWLTEQEDPRTVTLLYAVRSTDDIIFQPDFDAYVPIGNVQKVLYTTDHKADAVAWNGEVVKARLTSSDIVTHLTDRSQIYISGAETMVEQLHHELIKKHGLAGYRIAYDYFSGYATL